MRNSKDIPKEEEREELYYHITHSAIAWKTAEVSSKVIDKINILQATFLAMRKAIEKLSIRPALVLIDGPHTVPGLSYPQRAIVRGDERSASISAASIIAKVTRDRKMRKFAKLYPEFGFEFHKGYWGNTLHLNALNNFGITPIHRCSFSPVKERMK